MSDCGFIGLGRMGGAMARRLIDAGHQLIVHDPSAAAAAALAALGARVAPSARAVADAAPIVFLSLPNPQIVAEVVLGAQGIRSGKRLEVCVDLSTSGPDTALKLAAGLAERSIASLEAPVSGGIKGAREGTLSLMVAGPQATWEQLQPLLKVFGKPFFMGVNPGAGQTMKLVNNLLGACAIAITAEGMTLGAKAGLDPARMIEVLNVSSGRSSATQDKWPRSVLPRTFDFGFASGLCLKDVRLCLDAAESLGVPLGVGSSVRDLLERTVSTPGRRFGLYRHGQDRRSRRGPGSEPVRLSQTVLFREVNMSSELFDKGLKIRTEVLGEAYVKKALAGMDDFNKPLQELVTEYCWGAVWGREGLKRSERSMLNLAMISILNRPHELKAHIRGALTNGSPAIRSVRCSCRWRSMRASRPPWTASALPVRPSRNSTAPKAPRAWPCCIGEGPGIPFFRF